MQLRGILRASVHGQLKIMYPMVSGLDEIHSIRSILNEAKQELEKEGQPFSAFSHNFIKALGKMPFEKIQVTVRTADTFQINITRCQFVEVFQLLDMPELTPALCEGDVAYCEKYQPLIRFQRSHTLSAGDPFCDHTYYYHRQDEK